MVQIPDSENSDDDNLVVVACRNRMGFKFTLLVCLSHLYNLIVAG